MATLIILLGKIDSKALTIEKFCADHKSTQGDKGGGVKVLKNNCKRPLVAASCQIGIVSTI